MMKEELEIKKNLNEIFENLKEITRKNPVKTYIWIKVITELFNDLFNSFPEDIKNLSYDNEKNDIPYIG